MPLDSLDLEPVLLWRRHLCLDVISILLKTMTMPNEQSEQLTVDERCKKRISG